LYLTHYEERLLEGEEGEALERAIRLLITLGEVFGAKRLVKVKSAHISGVSYLNLGEAGLSFLEEQAEARARAQIRATLNPAGMDLERWREMAIPQSFAEKQLEVISAFERMNVETTCTCTPYLIGNEPKFGEQISWAESSAISYSNSVLGARTNRETGPTTLASAMTGRAALYGYRLVENRAPTGIIEVESSPRSRLEFSALGYVIGANMGNGVPYVQGIVASSLEDLKALGAAAATSGGTALYHIEGITPESKGFTARGLKGLEKLKIDRQLLEEAVSRLSSEVEKPIICLGCPHCSLNEIAEVAKILKDKRLKERLWVFTSRGVYTSAKRRGFVDVIEGSGGRVFTDTCMVVAPLEEMGVVEVSTNSCKAAQYLSNRGIKVALDNIDHLLREAIR